MLHRWSAVPALFLLASVPVVAQTTTGQPANSIAVVVRISQPPSIGRTQIIDAMRTSIPEYEQIPGLQRKYYTISDDNRLGGIYLFRDRASAEKHFSAEWRAAIRKRYGTDADLLYFSAPIQIEGKNAAGS